MTALKKQILKRGIKQNVLAAQLGISPAAVCIQTKTGIRRLRTARDYARAMNCKPHLLVDF